MHPRLSFVMGIVLALVLGSRWTTHAEQTPDIAPVPAMRIVTANATVRGRVTDINGAPIRSAEVRLRSTDGHDSRLATTDTNGQFEIRDLVSGEWKLTAFKPGFFSQSPGRGSNNTTERPLTLANGQRATVDVVLSRSGAIAGRVLDDAGEPLADVLVQAFKFRPIDIGTQLTAAGVADRSDDTGAFRLYAIPPGAYYVRAVIGSGNRAPGFTNDEDSTYYPSARDPQYAETVTVSAGQDQAGVVVTIPQAQKGVRVEGAIFSANGAPAGEDTTVELMRRSSVGLIARVSNGRFAVEGVPAGDYVLDAMGPRSTETWEQASMPLSVGTSPMSGVAVTMTPTRTVKGIVATDAGSQMRAVSLPVMVHEFAFDAPRSSHVVTVRAPGEFSIPGMWGVQAVSFDALPRGWMVKTIEIAGHELGSGPFDFSTVPPAATLRVVITDRIGEIAGTVVSGQQGRRAVVVVFPDDEAKWRRPSRYVTSVTTDDDGAFRVSGLNAMRYLAVAVPWVEPDEFPDAAFLAQLKKTATAFNLSEGEKKTLDLPLTAR